MNGLSDWCDRISVISTGLMPGWQGHWKHRWQTVSRTFLRMVAAALLVTYAWWHVFWLTQGRLPPALLLAFTGLPAPTTGGTRSVVHLFRGDWQGAWHHNPMAIPLLLLFVLTVGWLLMERTVRHRWRLPGGMLAAWLGVLAVAWLIKLQGMSW